MKDKTLERIMLVIVITLMLFVLVFIPVRAAISTSSYNYTDYCVDRFGEGFLPANHEGRDLMKCYSIEDGDMIEKVFKMSLAHESATCNYEIGFWELSGWEINNCNWEDDVKEVADE